MNSFNWDNGFSVDFNVKSGLSQTAESTKRYLSQMKGMYNDCSAEQSILSSGIDPLIYEFYELGCEPRKGDLLFGTTVLYPGKIGIEYYMTKGHFHVNINTAEVYWCISGEGYMVMENPEGVTTEQRLTKNSAIYVPRRFAHRMVNTGNSELIVFFSFAADAGHDYGTIETKGFHKLIVNVNGCPTIINNPRWK